MRDRSAAGLLVYTRAECTATVGICSGDSVCGSCSRREEASDHMQIMNIDANVRPSGGFT